MIWLAAGCAFVTAAAMLAWYFRDGREPCRCEEGFTPDLNGGRCLVCRGYERP